MSENATFDNAHQAMTKQLGAGVRQRRTAAGLTVTSVAQTAGISRRMLTMIEQGQANPSVLTLDQVASALGTAVAELLMPAAGPTSPQGPAETGPSAVAYPSDLAITMLKLHHGGGAQLRAHTPDPQGPELWTWTLQPGDVFEVEATTQATHLLFLVTRGCLHIHAGPTHVLHLQPGDSAWLRTDIAHRYANGGEEPCEWVQVTHATPT